MIKKINKYLLENHPLVWNTRLVWMIGILAFMHILCFAIGFLSFKGNVELHDYNIFESYFTKSYVWIGILISILIFILWFNQYFKQNGFKSLFPKSNGSLYKEFWIVFIISTLTISQYYSFTKGLETRVAAIKTPTELQLEMDLVRQVSPFTIQTTTVYNNDYSNQNRCIDVPLFDSLVNPDDLLRLYVSNKIKDRIWSDTIHLANYKNYKDSLYYALYSYPEFETLLANHFPERNSWVAPKEYKTFEKSRKSNDDYYDQYAYTEVAVAVDTPHEDSVAYRNLNSLYNFCNFPWTDSIQTQQSFALKNYQLLHNQQKDTIQEMLSDYLQLADFYQVSYRFKDKNWIDYVYNPPYYFVDYELSSISRYSPAHNEYYKKDHISEQDLTRALGNIDDAHNGVIPHQAYLVVLYLGLGIALLIYTFRTTSMRAWVISVVGMFILNIIFYSVFFMVSILLSGFDEKLAIFMGFGFIFMFNFLLFMGILSGKRKLITGVNLNWSIWTFPLIIPISVAYYVNLLTDQWNYIDPRPANLIWIEHNWDLILYLNLILVFIYLFVMIPILKKWQAMAEE